MERLSLSISPIELVALTIGGTVLFILAVAELIITSGKRLDSFKERIGPDINPDRARVLYHALSNQGVAAIKSKTDFLETEKWHLKSNKCRYGW
jgi:hypothetical protein